MDSFEVFNITFIVDDYAVCLDRNSNILKQKSISYKKCLKIDKIINNINIQKKIIKDIEDCIYFCETINFHYMIFKCLEYIDYLNESFYLSDNIKHIIYNTLSCKKRNHTNIFSFSDIEFLKKLVNSKKNCLKLNEEYVSNNNNI